ncbi:MAG: hypothetical protein WAX82_04385, partial [Gemmiger qucibialis]
RLRHGICVAKMLDKTSSIICAFGLAAAAPRSPYRHLELCGIAIKIVNRPAEVQRCTRRGGFASDKSVKSYLVRGGILGYAGSRERDENSKGAFCNEI